MMVDQEPQKAFQTRTYFVESPVGRSSVYSVSPLEPKTDIPVVIAAGWSGSPKTYFPSQTVLASRGRTSFVFDHPRRGGEVKLNSPYPEAESRKAYTLLEVIKSTDKAKVDVLAHSEGAIYTAIAASLKPEKFRNIVFVAPAGMIGKDTIVQLLKRSYRKSVRHKAQATAERTTAVRFKNVQKDSVSYFLQNPQRAIDEGIAISKSDISGMLTHLHSKGIGIVIIQHAEDEAFPLERIQKKAKTTQFNGILSVTGLHDDVYMHPEKYTAAAEEMLTALENKHNQFSSNSVSNPSDDAVTSTEK